MRHMVANQKKIVFGLVMLLGVVFFLELILHALCFLSPKVNGLLHARSGLAVSDEKLGLRPSPVFPDHDERGWRNAKTQKNPTIIAVGDSMTYGVWAKREDAWPQQLEQISGIQTYNMGFSGYSPATYLLMLDELLELRPKLIIEAVYSGNDFWETYESIYLDNRLPEFRTADKKTLDELSAEEKKSNKQNQSTNLFEPHRGLKNFLDEYSKIYAILWVGKAFLIPDHTWPWPWIKYKASRFDGWEIFQRADVNTILSPAYRLLGMDMDDPRIQEGLAASLSIIKETNRRLKTAGVNHLILFLPTKEFVLSTMADASNFKNPTNMWHLVNCEEKIWKTLQDGLTDQGILFVDPLPELRRCVEERRNPYLINHDSHPHKLGLKTIAETVYTKILEAKLLENYR